MKLRGEMFALGAAICNGTIGIFSRLGLSENADHMAIALLRCVGGLMLLAAILALRTDGLAKAWALRRQWPQIAVLAFFGVFTLYYFETWSLVYAPVPVVSVLTYSGGILAILLGVMFLKEQINFLKLLTCVFVFAGVYLMFVSIGGWGDTAYGAFLAVVAGFGYSLFLFLWRLFKMSGGLPMLLWFFGFGAIYLSIPFFLSGANLPPPSATPAIVGLILIPTLCGYYCTSRALELAEAGRVQLIETSEPLFASVLAFLIFGELLNLMGAVGAGAIMVGLMLLIFPQALFRRPGTIGIPER